MGLGGSTRLSTPAGRATSHRPRLSATSGSSKYTSTAFSLHRRRRSPRDSGAASSAPRLPFCILDPPADPMWRRSLNLLALCATCFHYTVGCSQLHRSRQPPASAGEASSTPGLFGPFAPSSQLVHAGHQLASHALKLAVIPQNF